MKSVPISLTVNGEVVEALVPPRQHLADFLRETLGLPARTSVVSKVFAALARFA